MVNFNIAPNIETLKKLLTEGLLFSPSVDGFKKILPNEFNNRVINGNIYYNDTQIVNYSREVFSLFYEKMQLIVIDSLPLSVFIIPMKGLYYQTTQLYNLLSLQNIIKNFPLYPRENKITALYKTHERFRYHIFRKDIMCF